MSRSYLLTGIVKRVVMDEVTLQVEADTELEAFGKASRVLETFPEKTYMDGVPYVFIENRTTISTSVDDIYQKKDKGVA